MKIRNLVEGLLKTGNGVVELLYPPTCAGCIRNEPLPNHIFCVPCLSEMSFTESHKIEVPQIERHFWGRIPFEWGMSMLYLVPGGVTQQMLYQVKYHGRRDVAARIGAWYGATVLSGPRYQPVDLIVPVPLHWKKQQKRGYNQSAFFARGLAVSLGAPCDEKHLVRVSNTRTQTRKSRFERLENIRGAFRVVDPGQFERKHILLVDDVLTTGATLEACALQLLPCARTRLSFLTIATGKI